MLRLYLIDKHLFFNFDRDKCFCIFGITAFKMAMRRTPFRNWGASNNPTQFYYEHT